MKVILKLQLSKSSAQLGAFYGRPKLFCSFETHIQPVLNSLYLYYALPLFILSFLPPPPLHQTVPVYSSFYSGSCVFTYFYMLILLLFTLWEHREWPIQTEYWIREACEKIFVRTENDKKPEIREIEEQSKWFVYCQRTVAEFGIEFILRSHIDTFNPEDVSSLLGALSKEYLSKTSPFQDNARVNKEKS